MSSLFYPTEQLTLPFLFYEAVTELQDKTPDIVLAQLIVQAHKICFDRSPGAGKVDRIAGRLIKEAEQAEKRAQEQAGPFKRKAPAEAKRKSYGGFLIDWIGGLDAQAVCIFVADFDLREARRLYCQEDKWAVIKLSELKGAFVWEQARAAHEAVLFGMGGGYKGYTPEDRENTVNLSEMEGPVPMAQLAKFGLAPKK